MGSSSGGTRCRTGQPWSSLADGVLASSITQQERGVPVRSLSLEPPGFSHGHSALMT